ncbi:MAG: hypothetical protein KDJ36_14240, partial [Hyphomicrobiaceae bacterium]|nr:hypothetical protein [Hyphomicrobiaceae bacterium]
SSRCSRRDRRGYFSIFSRPIAAVAKNILRYQQVGARIDFKAAATDFVANTASERELALREGSSRRKAEFE